MGDPFAVDRIPYELLESSFEPSIELFRMIALELLRYRP